MTDTREDPFRNSDDVFWDHVDVNDCGYLLRTLEREAYTSVVNALRAKGPPSEHSFLLLDHLRSALSINDELGRAEVRRAAFDPKLCKVANVLNPNYDTSTEWSACAMEARGTVESGPCRGRPFAGTSSSSIADQLLKEAAIVNERTSRATGRAFELLAMPHKPFVPERLRVLLRETDRPEQRIPPPLEAPPSPPPVPAPVAAIERTARSEDRPPPAKKRRHRTSKGAKAKGDNNPPELVPEKRERKEDEEIPSTSTAAAAAAAVAPPVTPLAATAAAPSTVMGSTGSVIISPGQPPQSGDAMKTWEQELAASAKKNGGVLPSPVADVSSGPSTSTTPVTPAAPSDSDASAKKKRRSRNDPYYLNTCARTRPFQFDKEDKKGKQPVKGVPEKSSSSKPPGTPAAPTAAPINQIAGPSVTPTATIPTYSTPGRRNSMDDVASADSDCRIVGESVRATGAVAAGYSGGGGMKPMTPTAVLLQQNAMKKAQAAANAARGPQSRYYVNSSGVSSTPPGPSSAVKASSITGGIGGRSGSLGSQQLHGTTSGFQFVSQKASASNSSSSINSTGGGSMGSGIGASSSSTSVLSADQSVHPVNAPPPESAGHDYGINYTTALVINQGSANGGYLNPSGPLRLAPRVQQRDPWPAPLIRSPQGVPPPAHHHPPNGLVPIPPLQRAGSMSSMRPRLGSRGAAAAGVAVPAAGGPATDAAVQAIVHNIQMETAQKECANGKRASVLPNGVLHHQSAPSMPLQSAHPYPVCRPSTSSDSAASSSSMMGHQPLPPQPVPPSRLHPQPVPPPRLPPGLTIPAASRILSYGPSTSPFYGGGGPSTSSAPLPPSMPPAAPPPPANPAMLSIVKNALLAMNAEKMAGSSTTIADQVNAAVFGSAAPQEQQQHQQQPPAAAAAPPRPPAQTQRQYVLQPQGIGYAEYQPDNPTSYKSFATDGSLVQYGVSPEELYDQGVLARPSTSGMGGGSGAGGGGGGMRRPLQPPQPPPPVAIPFLQQAQATAAQMGVPSSFSIPSTAGGGHDDGQMPSTSRDLQQPPDAAASSSREASASSDGKDILEKSCRELR